MATLTIPQFFPQPFQNRILPTNNSPIMADDMDNVMLRLRSMPDENGVSRDFEISYGAAKLSELIKDSVGEEIEDDDAAVQEIDVPRVKGDCLEKVVAFMKHYKEEPMKEIPTPLGGSSFNEVSSGAR
jgi:Skp1 family, tetramerisation domain